MTDDKLSTTGPGAALPPGLAALVARAGKQKGSKPPVDKWNPDFCGDLDMRIARDGSWHYLGSPIGRERLVRLFASVLRKDADGRHYLVTPVEKIGIQVDDVAFVGVELHAEGQRRAQQLVVRTNVGDVVEVGANHPLRFVTDAENGGLIPYVLVRGRLEARLGRPLLYELADLLEPVEGDEAHSGVWSGGEFFPVGLAG